LRRPTHRSTIVPDAPSLEDSAGSALLSPLIEEHLERLASVLRQVLAEGDPDSVHDLRVVTRRLQQVLTALSPRPRAKKIDRLRRTLRRIRRSLGSWRNYDVTLETVAKRRRASRSSRKRAAWDVVRDYLDKRRMEETIRARRRILDEHPETLADRLRAALSDRLEKTSTRDLHQTLLVRVEATWLAWEQSFQRAEQERAVPAVHALRIATKRLRYRAELARSLDEPALDRVLDWAKGVQQVLGDWHDRQVLHQLIAEALARPEVLLGQLEVVQTALGELRRERRQAPLQDAELPAPSWREEGRQALEHWLGQGAPAGVA